jgi:hypothetical protein
LLKQDQADLVEPGCGGLNLTNLDRSVPAMLSIISGFENGLLVSVHAY